VLNNTTILARISSSMEWLMREAAEITMHPYEMKRDHGNP
jgi:hypothetical protein